VDNIEKIRQVANFFENKIIDNDIHCEFCDTKHTGRNAYSIGIFLCQFEQTKEDKYFQLAYSMAKTTMSKLQPDPIHGGLIFLPGNHEGANQSNSVMDAGMCTDMISSFLIYCDKNNILIEEKDIWIDKLALHIDGYLADTSLNKTVLNQRLWGLTGIVSFFKLQNREKDKLHIETVLEKTFSEQNDDFSFGYVATKDDKDPSTYFSVYYYSRLIAYLCFAVQSVNLQDKYQQNIKNSLTLMYDCIDNQGKKILDLETKKLFFQASYEVESLSHDIFVSRFVNQYYKYGSNDILDKIQEIYLKHIDKNGMNSNYENKPNLLCSFIDNSDFIWYVRSLDFEGKQELSHYNAQNRVYLDAGFIVEYKDNNKKITLINKYYSSIGWGDKNDTKIVLLGTNKKVIKGHNNFYSLKYMIKRNYGDIKNMIYTSQYNLKFKGSRMKYFYRKAKQWLI
jgi:hypothetical protein